MNRLPLTTQLWEFVGLALLLAVYLASDALFDRAGYQLMNVVGPLWLTALLCLGAARMVRADAGALWTALFWFRVSSAAYYGVGSLVPMLSDDITRARMQAFFRFYGEDVAKANIIFTVGIIVVLASANVCQAFVGSGRRGRGQMLRLRGSGAMLAAGLLFLAVGASVKYLFLLPTLFGLTDFVMPGAVGALGKLTFAAIFLLAAWSRQNAKSLLPLVAGFAALEMFVGILAFNKSEVVGALLMFLLAFVWDRTTLARLAIVAGIVATTYFLSVPIVEFGRAELLARNGTLGNADFSERLEILSRATHVAPSVPDDASVTHGMTRLSYVNQATFAVHEYDSLRPGNSFADFFAVFIPRALWPDKPIITKVANDFNESATGNAASASSPGLFAEAYWNFGWLGVVLLMTLLGVVLALLSRYALYVIHSGLWLFFPVVLQAMRIGFRTDGYFVADIVGGTLMAVALHVVLLLVDAPLFTFFRRSAPRPRGMHRAPPARMHQAPRRVA
jgi:hypothetical protein